MIEAVIKEYLDAQLSEPVYLQKPDPAPDRYVLFEKTGSGRRNGALSSTFAFQSYAESLYQAAMLNEKVKVAVDSLINLDNIGSARLNTDYNFTNTTTKKYRYQAVYDINHY